MRYVTGSVAIRWCWIPLIVAAGCVVASMYDTTWLFVGLIVGLAVPVMVLPLMILSHAMMPEAIVSVHEHTVSVCPDGVSVDVLAFPSLSRRYGMKDIEMVRIARDTVIISLRHPRHHYVIIEPDAVDDDGRQRIMAMLAPVDGNRGVDV